MGFRERIRASIDDIRAHGRRVVQLNIDLLKTELQQKAQQYGAGVALFAVAGLLSLYALGFALATITVALALVLPLWLALLIVTLLLVVVIVILALVGRGRLRAAKTPAPQAAVAEAQATAAAVKTGAARVAARVRPGGGTTPRPAEPDLPPPVTPAPAPPSAPPGSGEKA